MGSLVAAGGVAGACFWLPIYPVSACPLLDEALHVVHIVQLLRKALAFQIKVLACFHSHASLPGESRDTVIIPCTTKPRAPKKLAAVRTFIQCIDFSLLT